MILVDLNGKDLLKELMSAYVGNDAIAQACKSALDCIESAEALSKVSFPAKESALPWVHSVAATTG